MYIRYICIIKLSTYSHDLFTRTIHTHDSAGLGDRYWSELRPESSVTETFLWMRMMRMRIYEDKVQSDMMVMLVVMMMMKMRMRMRMRMIVYSKLAKWCAEFRSRPHVHCTLPQHVAWVYVATWVKSSESHQLRCFESDIAELIKCWPRELHISFGWLSESLHEDTGRWRWQRYIDLEMSCGWNDTPVVTIHIEPSSYVLYIMIWYEF